MNRETMLLETMRMALKSTLLLYVMICMFSCSMTGSYELREEYASFLGKKIHIPYRKMTVLSVKNDSVSSKKEDNSDYVYVSYINSTACTPCHLSRVNEWEDIITLFEKANLPINIIIIYAVNENNISEIRRSYIANGCLRDVYLDISNAFEMTNESLPEDIRLHTFLLNTQCQVVLLGDPTRNAKIRDLVKDYIKTIEK